MSFHVWDEIERRGFFRDFLKVAKGEPSLFLEGLSDTPKGLLALLFAKNSGKRVAIITGRGREGALSEVLSLFSEEKALFFPPRDALTEGLSPNLDLIGKRFATLHALSSAPQILSMPLQAALQRVCSPDFLERKVATWKRGDRLSFRGLEERLTHLGYKREMVVVDKGDFAIRDGVLDLFPISSLDPYRVRFSGDTIDRIFTYNCGDQRSIEEGESLFLSPTFEGESSEKEPYLHTVLDYLGPDTLLVFDDLLSIEESYSDMKKLPSLFLAFSEWERRFKGLQRIYFSRGSGGSPKTDPIETPLHFLGSTTQTKRMRHPFVSIEAFLGERTPAKERLQALVEKGKEMRLFLYASSEAEEGQLKGEIDPMPFPKKWAFVRGYLPSGFVLPEVGFALFSYAEFTSTWRIPSQEWRHTHYAPLSVFQDLTKGDLVVHFHNGIGKYLGVERRNDLLGNEEEFLSIEYAQGGKLLVPLSQSHLVSRYVGGGGKKPSLSALGTKKWLRIRSHAQRAIDTYAHSLIELHALREVEGGFSFGEDSEEMRLFEGEFPFELTEDQARAVAEVKGDMQSKRAMDRLICGDVGYGKTEVAMRAACKAVIDGGKQVALLAPTTVLVMQHYETFKERMRHFPIRIGVASRFVGTRGIKETLEGVSRGEVDILIGTHRIVGKEVAFKDLGLILIDEEQRFGVRVKERLKSMKAGVDCLALSATPIPRTLHLSLVGVRDLSLINTPPRNRIPVKRIVVERSDRPIREGILRELSRGGQVYFIHNRIDSISRIAEEVAALVPDLRIEIVHGQMGADAIDAVFHRFKRGEVDVLVATTIVENGIDIPNANTIFVDRSDTYGIADLYQLCGRVGRSNRPAYAYFFLPKDRALRELTHKRLRALIEDRGFGGGMRLAMRDLEIRGAGDLLGLQQSGHLAAVGFHFYCTMLKRAVAKLKGERTSDFFETKVEFPFPASLPSTYIAEAKLRMEIYHRIGEMSSREEIDALFEELVDRFGSLPLEAKWFHHLQRIRLFASQHGISLLRFQRGSLFVREKRGERLLPFPACDDPPLFERIAIELLQRAIRS